MCSFFLTDFTGPPERIHLHYCKWLLVRKTEISESGQLQLLLLSEIEKIRKKSTNQILFDSSPSVKSDVWTL